MIFKNKYVKYCCFCGRHKDEKGILLIAGPATSICNFCVQKCAEIIAIKNLNDNGGADSDGDDNEE